MSRKSRIIDKSDWKLPTIYGFVGDYGPMKIKGYEPLDNVTVLLMNSSTSDSHHQQESDDSSTNDSPIHHQHRRHHRRHPMYDIAGQIQKLILLSLEDVRTNDEDEEENDPSSTPPLVTMAASSGSNNKFLVLDIKDMFDSYEEYQSSLRKEGIPITNTTSATTSNSCNDDDGNDNEQPPPPATTSSTTTTTSSSAAVATTAVVSSSLSSSSTSATTSQEEHYSSSTGAGELTKGFGKSLLRILQRLLLQNCTLIAYDELSLLILKLYKAAYSIDQDMISQLILIHPPSTPQVVQVGIEKFIHNLGLKKQHVVVTTKNNNNNNNTSDKKLKKNGTTRKINSKRQQKKAIKKQQQQQQQNPPPTLHLILMDNNNEGGDDDGKGNNSQQQQRQQQQQNLETIFRSYFPIGTTKIFPKSSSIGANNSSNNSNSSCTGNNLVIILSGGNNNNRKNKKKNSIITTDDDNNSNKNKNNDQYHAYDPEYYNPLGQRLFCSQITIEMNKYSKQYERICEDITTTKLTEISIVVKKKQPIIEHTIATEEAAASAEDANAETTQIDWSSCVDHLDHHRRHIGALVLRGNRCVLIRSLQKYNKEKWNGMRLPSVEPLPQESPKEACYRAIEYYTEVDAINECKFLNHINPVKIYDNQRQIIIELYALVAIEPPPYGPLEDADIEDEDESLYDWYTYPNAIKRLESDEQQHIICGLQIMSLHLIQAANVGLIEVKWGGIFGQEIRLGIVCNDDNNNNNKNNSSISIGGGGSSSLLTVPVEEWEQQQHQQQQNGTSNDHHHHNHHHNHHHHHHHDDKRDQGGPSLPSSSHTTSIKHNNDNGSQPGDVVGKLEKPKQEEAKRELIESSKATDNITTTPSPPVNNNKKKLPVTILSGFLGSGKTTLMSHILTNIQGLKVAILVNDMGEINIDAALLQKNNVGITQREENLVEMSNGCICCTLREDLLIEITNIATSAHNFDYLLIESSGISEPMPVAETFTFEDHNTGTSLGDIAEIDTLVTVVDGSRFLQELDSLDSLRQRNWHADPEDQRTISHLLCDQLEFANVIVLNKCDLLTNDEKGKIIRVIQSMNPTSNLVESTYSSVALNRVLGTKLFSMSDAEKHEGWLQEARIGEHKPESEEYGIGSFTYRSLKPFHPNKLYNALEMMVSTSTTMTKRSTSGGDGDDDGNDNKSIILRAKGFVWIANRPHVQGDFSLAGSIYTLLPGNPWWAVIEKSEWPPNLEQAIAPLWHEPYGDRQQEIVIIGQSLNVSKITKQLDDCLMTDEQFKLGQEAWFDLLEGTADPFSSTWDVVVENDAHADHDHHHDHHHHEHDHHHHDGHDSNQGCTDEDCGNDTCDHQHDHQHSHEHCHDH